MTAGRAAPAYLTSRDAAAILGIPEPRVRQLIRDGTLDGFRGGGHWILPAGQIIPAADAATSAGWRQPPDSGPALRADYPSWRVCTLSAGYAAVLDAAAPGRRAVVLAAITIPALRGELQRWHRDHGARP